jgi:HEPN domain-containing protein
MKKGTREWLEFAKRDLEAAKALVSNDYLANIVLFHAQQCIEKSFKAVLEEYGIKIPKIHNVIKLCSIIEEHTDISFAVQKDKLDMIDLVYVDTRYPSGFGLLPSGSPTDKESKESIEIAEKVYKEVIDKLTKDKSESDRKCDSELTLQISGQAAE